MKPFKGDISNWVKVFFNKKDFPEAPESLGYYIKGIPHGHPEFHNWICTSPVVKHDESTGEIETFNSRYKLV